MAISRDQSSVGQNIKKIFFMRESFFPFFSFDIINFVFDRCFNFEFVCFHFDVDYVVNTHIFNPFIEGCENCRKIYFLGSLIFDETLFVISFRTFVSSERTTSSYPNLLNYSCCLSNISSDRVNISSNLANMALVVL